MNLEKFVVRAGITGVHKIVTTRSNGLIIEDKHENRTRFVPVRSNQFTPLATIAIYTETEEGTIPLGDVWQRMYDQMEAIPPVPQSSNSSKIRAYFEQILQEYDKDKEHVKDIKKCLKWFMFMHEKGLLAEAIAAGQKKEETTETTPDNAE